MTTDASDLEPRLRDTLTRTADAVVDRPRPALSWEKPGATATVTELAGRRPRLRTVVRIAAPVAVAAAVAAAVALPGGPAVNAPARSVPLQETALLAPGSDVPLQAGQYLYTKTTYQTTQKGDVPITAVDEYWVPQDATGEWTYRATAYDPATGQPVPRFYDPVTAEPITGPHVETAPCGHFAHPEDTSCTDAGSWDVPTPRFIANLPTDPAALGALLVEWGDRWTRLAEGNGYPVGSGSALDQEYATLHEPMTAASNLAESTVGMSQPFSHALEQAIAELPGVVARPATNLDGVPGTSYAAVASDGWGVSDAMVFDADGNYIGTPTSAVVVGAADQAGVAPAGR